MYKMYDVFEACISIHFKKKDKDAILTEKTETVENTVRYLFYLDCNKIQNKLEKT